MNRMMQLKKLYGENKAHGVLMQCSYEVRLEDVFGIGADIPWFKDKSLRYLVTDTDLSYGSLESETFKAGTHQASYITGASEDTIDMTFIETTKGAIFNSYRRCYKRAVPGDGTVNEPKKYTFKLTINLLNHNDIDAKPVFGRSWLVSVKEGKTNLSSAGRSEIVKVPITFQKIRPLMFER